jgi:predicted DNA-binding transcriptional regulator YafY
MSKRESISRYNLLIKKLRKSSSTFEEIADYLSRESELQSYNFNVSKRTFQRDLDDIRSLFNIDIQYDHTRKFYCIIDEESPEVNERILEAFDTFNALNVSDGLSKYIHFEKRRPQGTENLYGLLHGIKNRFRINFSYQKFWEEEGSNREIEPFGLKEFKNRWYVLGKDLKDEKIKTFALDRLTNLEITRKKFEFPKNFNIEESYRYCFGIISPNNEEPLDIVLSFDPVQGKYIKTLPLHETQQVVVDNEDELQIKLKLCVTQDLVMELLSYGDNMKVLKPKSLANKIKSELQKAFKQYR